MLIDSQNKFIVSVVLFFLGMFCIPVIQLHPQATTILWLCFFCCNIHIFKSALSRRFLVYNLLVFLFCFIVCLSWIQSRNYLPQYVDLMSMTSSFVRVLFQCFGLLLTIFFIEDAVKKNRSELFFRVLYKCFLLYVLIMNIQALALPRSVVLDQIFWAGNKFNLCYSNVYLMLLFYLKTDNWGRRERNIFMNIVIVNFFMSVYAECSTTILGVSLFLLLLKLKSLRLMKFLCNPVFFIGSLLFCTFALISFSSIVLNVGYVRFLIQDVLGESLDLTGRMILYEKMGDLLVERPLWGYGLGNVANVIHPLLKNIHNAQNGVLNLYLQIGGIGVLSFFSLYVYLLRRINENERAFPVVAYVYMILLISIVEIPFGFSSIFFITCAFLCENMDNQKRKT